MEVLFFFAFSDRIYYSTFGSYRMKLNGKLSQRCWQEVKHCVLDDTMGM